MLQGPASSPVSLSSMGPATCTGPGTASMRMECLQGAPSLVEPLTHTKLHMQVLGSLHGGRPIRPLQSLLLAVLYTCRCDVGGIFLSWGGGLKQPRKSCITLSFKLKNIKQKCFAMFCWFNILRKDLLAGNVDYCISLVVN